MALDLVIAQGKDVGVAIPVRVGHGLRQDVVVGAVEADGAGRYEGGLEHVHNAPHDLPFGRELTGGDLPGVF